MCHLGQLKALFVKSGLNSFFQNLRLTFKCYIWRCCLKRWRRSFIPILARFHGVEHAKQIITVYLRVETRLG